MKALKFSLFIVALILIAACKKTEMEPACERNVVVITDDIDAPTNWTSDNIYVIEAINFWVTSTLTIEPGTIIKFSPGQAMEVQQNGVIIANGTADAPITFTSVRDDIICDTNNDGTTTSPAAKDWSRILVATNGSVFNHCRFYYGGDNTWESTLETRTNAITITNSVFAHNVGGPYLGTFYGALSARTTSEQSVIEDNLFFDNRVPLVVNASVDLGTGNQFSNPDNNAQLNEQNAIFVYGDIDDATTWEETEVPFVSATSTLFLRDDFTVAANVIVKVTEGNGVTITNEGELFLDPNAIFTSFKDDAVGGDSNGDGSASTPTKGDWEGIWDPRIPGNTFYIGGPNIRYAQNP